MKFVALWVIFMTTFTAQAATANNCATKQSEIANIAGLMSKINPWGVWQGSADGDTVVIDLSLQSNGKFMATADFAGKKFGPLNVKVCEYVDAYSLVIYGYEVEFKVLNKNKLEILMAVGNSPSVVLNKTVNYK